MEYQIEDLLPITAKLIEKYTSKESTSVTYETAQTLMGAVIYTIRECETKEGLRSNEMLDVWKIYEHGKLIIKEKGHQAKEIYNEIIAEFEDYGCLNYRNTMVKGIPQFFIHYQIDFKPQDHILTLDYPTLYPITGRCGVDLILEYLKRIRREQIFLQGFSTREVCGVLENILPEYEELYLDNICEAVIDYTDKSNCLNF